jgi:hypothetical protein
MDGSLSPLIKVGLPAIAVLAGIGGYALHERNSAQNLATQNAQITAQLSATNSQMRALSSQVNTLVANDQARQAAQAAAAATPVRHTAGHARSGTHAYDPRYKKLQSQLDAQGKAIDQERADIASTQSDLSNTRTELNGNIARNHDQLVLLQKRGERNYYEFDLNKSKQLTREGPIGIALRKANIRHQFADLQLMVSDSNLSQKHVNLYQPAMFYVPDSPQPIEIVINAISKNHIHGYISAPKYRQSELTAMSSAEANPAQATNDPAGANAGAQPPTRQKLPVPSASEIQ